MKKKEIKNCWEYMQCGREPGGNKADELGVCPVTTAERFNGVNGGENGGRFCWFVSGTLCKGEVQGTFARKLGNCLGCPFYLLVEKEEGRYLVLTDDDM
jgi:hypothetical protein